MKGLCFVLLIFLLSGLLLNASCITINQPPAQTPTPTPTQAPTSTAIPAPSATLPPIQTFVAPESVPPINPLQFAAAQQRIDQAFIKLFGEIYYANHPNLVSYYYPQDIAALTRVINDLKTLIKWEYKADYFDCSNMSSLTQYALTAAGFETLIVVGYDIAHGERAGHAWVVIILRSSQSGVELVPVETTTTGGPSIPAKGSRVAYRLGNEVHYQTYDDYISQGYAMQNIYQAEQYCPGDFNWWNSCQIDVSWFKHGSVTPTTTPTPTPTLVPIPSTTTTYTPTPTPTLTFTNFQKILINQNITLKAGNYYEVPFTVNIATMLNVQVVGSFKALGGSGNDIDAYIMTDSQLQSWLKGQKAVGIYVSGRVSSADLTVPILTSGTYHLVFSNDFSILSAKVVSANIILKWQERR